MSQLTTKQRKVLPQPRATVVCKNCGFWWETSISTTRAWCFNCFGDYMLPEKK